MRGAFAIYAYGAIAIGAVVLVLAVFGAQRVLAAPAPVKNKVIDLSPEALGKIEASSDVWLVQFTSGSCGAECETAGAAFQKASFALEGAASFGTTADTAAAAKLGVSSFPSYKLWTPSTDAKAAAKGAFSDYAGKPSADGFTAAAYAAVKAVAEARLGPKQEEAKKGQQEGGKPAGSMYEGSEVVELTDEQFENEVLNGKEAWLVEFYAPWCGHCKNLVPVWKEAAAAATGIRIAAIDATAHDKFSSKYGVKGFPTIKFFKPSEPEQTPEEYNGGRTADAVIAFCEEKAAAFGKGTPAVVAQAQSQEQLDKECLNKLLCVVFAVPHVAFTGASGRNAHLETLGKVAAKFRSRPAAFVWISGGDHEKFERGFGIEGNYPTFVAVNKEKLKYSTFTGQFSVAAIADHLSLLLGGRKSMSTLKKGAELPTLSKNVPLWDGKDYSESDE